MCCSYNNLKKVPKYSAVSVAGGYWTGSSAVIDLLNEHRLCAIVENEFTLFSYGQFFKDVYIPILDGYCDPHKFKYNIKRFESFNKSDHYPARSILRKICRTLDIYPPILFWKQAGMAKSLGCNYERACKDFLSSLNKIYFDELIVSETTLREQLELIISLTIDASIKATAGVKSEAILGVFDQIVAPPYASYSARAFPSMKHINVDRNWKDQYISLRNIYKIILKSNLATGTKPWDEDLELLLKLGPVEYFIKIRQFINDIKAHQQDLGNTLWINFEELIEFPKESARTIFDFLELSYHDWQPNTHFHPDQSRKKMGKWKILGKISQQVLNEIDQLENRLNF